MNDIAAFTNSQNFAIGFVLMTNPGIY